MDQAGTLQFVSARDLDHALSILHDMGSKAEVVAGATWIMRAPIRGEPTPRTYVSLAGIKPLHDIEIDADTASIGAMTTHHALELALAGHADLGALAMAAGHSATPAVRRMATIGGNISTRGFPPADLVTALIALDATVETASLQGLQSLGIADVIRRLAKGGHATLVTRILIPRSNSVSAHARLTLREAGEYPVANVSVSLALTPDGTIDHARVAVGAVESIAKRWSIFENEIIGLRPDPAEMQRIAKARLDVFAGRDGVDAPGWYRTRVLPGLVAKVFTSLNEQA